MTPRSARRRGLSDRQVQALPKKPRRYVVSDPELRGHYVRVPPAGPNVFVAVARDPYGKQVWATHGTADTLTIDEARDRARSAIKRIKAGLTPIEPPPVRPDSFAATAATWISRHVEAKKLRTRDEIERVLKRYVLPHWAARPFEEIKRSDVAKLLDHVEDNHGKRQADVVLSIIRAIGNWYSTRNDSYTAPFVRGMARVDAGAGRRSRILADDELRAVWKAAESAGNFGALVQILLLSAQRLAKVGALKWSDLDDNGIWNIATEAREKSNAESLQLPPLALEIIRAQPRIISNPYVFPGKGHGPFGNFAKGKTALDRASGVSGWVLHDCRRTARSLMSRVGVRPDISERVLGHAIKGVEGVYDRHRYDPEKADALQRLAHLIQSIVDPIPNVVTLRPHGAAST